MIREPGILMCAFPKMSVYLFVSRLVRSYYLSDFGAAGCVLSSHSTLMIFHWPLTLHFFQIVHPARSHDLHNRNIWLKRYVSTAACFGVLHLRHRAHLVQATNAPRVGARPRVWRVLKTRGEPQMTDEPLESQQGLKKQRIL